MRLLQKLNYIVYKNAFRIMGIVVSLIIGNVTPSSSMIMPEQIPLVKEGKKGFCIIGGYVVSLNNYSISIEVQGKMYTVKISNSTRFIDEDENIISPNSLTKGCFVRISTTDTTASEAHTVMKAKDTGYSGIVIFNQ